MNYTYVENVETSAYTLTVTTDTDLFPLINSDNFEIGIFDEINGQNTVINKNNFQLFGINDKNPDLDSRLENSLIKNNIKERFIDLFVCPSKKVQVFVGDLFGMRLRFKDPDIKNRWLLRLVPDTFDKHYQDAVQDNMGFNMPEILLEACKRRFDN